MSTKIRADLFDSSDKRELQRTFRDLIAKIPEDCTQSNSLFSWAYLCFDFFLVALVSGLGFYAWNHNSYLLMSLYIFLQGSCFWSLFVIGHDSGHGSFSSRNWENLLSGYLTHTFLLVPYFSWKLSHHKHHSYHNMVENDETHTAISRSFLKQFELDYAAFSVWKKSWVLFYLVLSAVGLPFIPYLIDSHVLRDDSFSHFNPKAKIYRRHAKQILLSGAGLVLMLGLLGFFAFATSLSFMIYMYFAPWLVFSLWIYAVTYLHHTHSENYWFYAEDWHFLKGALQTVDYDFGRFWGPIVNFFHHNIERYHVVHHIIPSVPHYKLKKAHEAIQETIAEVYNLNHAPLKNYVLFKYKMGLAVVDDKEADRKKYRMQPLKSPVVRDRAVVIEGNSGEPMLSVPETSWAGTFSGA